MSDTKKMQAQMKTQMDLRGAAMDQYSQEQHLIAQQIQANGAAIAQLTLRQWEMDPKDEAKYDVDENASLLFDDNASFQNVFAKDKHTHKTEPSKNNKKVHKEDTKEQLSKHAMPKMNFPIFDGSDPKVWLDNCISYFDLYQLPEGMWVTAATLHLKDNAAKWYQAYKHKTLSKTGSNSVP
jgi:hypothetical protein